MSEKYDIIIIGSGMGALSLAGIMARYNKSRVLILEKHYKAGGFTHTFKRKNKFSWSTGIHYVGDLQKGTYLSNIFDYITHKKMKWQKLPEFFEKFIYRDFKFEVNSDPIKYKNDLVSMFPEEEEAIRKYFIEIRLMANWYRLYIFSKISFNNSAKMSSEEMREFVKLSTLTTQQYLDRNFTNENLKSILISQIGNYGVSPESSPFVFHASIVCHYLYGGWYPASNSESISDLIIPYIEKAGGKILLKHEVTEIIVNENRAIGVKVKNREDMNFYADIIVSDAGAYNTYVKLLPPLDSIIDYRNGILEYLKKFPPCFNLILFLGLKKNSNDLGFKGENSWLFNSKQANLSWNLQDDDIYVYLTVNPKKSTAIAITCCTYNPFEQWRHLPSSKRGKDYKKLKDDLTEKMLQTIEKNYPGFCELIEFKELATPLTVEHYSSHYKGSVYGLSIQVDRFDEAKSPWFDFKTPIENFYLTGVDALGPGISCATLSGAGAAAHILQSDEIFDLFEIITRRNN